MKKSVLITVLLLILSYGGYAVAVSFDKEIRNDIKSQLEWDLRVDADKINVKVNSGKVTLKGTVDSYRAFQAAEEDAWDVTGVITVDNDLIIKYPSTVKFPSDREIKTNIENMLLWNNNLDSTDIKVRVDNGIVTLRGSVDSYWGKLKAEDIAEDANGILMVSNLLAVVPTNDYADEILAREIINAIDRNYHVSAESINVKVKNGVVAMSGTVPNWTAREAAYDAARYNPGVIDVKERIDIR